MCDQIFQILGAQLLGPPSSSSPQVAHEPNANVRCRTRLTIIFVLILGLLSTGALAIATVTDYWIFTQEPYDPNLNPEMNGTTFVLHINAGLWRVCYRIELYPAKEMMPDTSCVEINYFSTYKKIEAGLEPETSWAILRGIRKASPLIVLSLGMLITAMVLCTLGNTRYSGKTLTGAVLYIVEDMVLALGVIFYISAVNDEVAHRKPPSDPKIPPFSYSYGWCFYFTGGSFLLSMCASVANITLYLKRYKNLEDMIAIIPGLDEKSGINHGVVSLSRDQETLDEDLDYPDCSQNPTIIL